MRKVKCKQTYYHFFCREFKFRLGKTIKITKKRPSYGMSFSRIRNKKSNHKQDKRFLYRISTGLLSTLYSEAITRPYFSKSPDVYMSRPSSVYMSHSMFSSCIFSIPFSGERWKILLVKLSQSTHFLPTSVTLIISLLFSPDRGFTRWWYSFPSIFHFRLYRPDVATAVLLRTILRSTTREKGFSIPIVQGSHDPLSPCAYISPPAFTKKSS
jgi:hypothetical protein